MPEDDAIQTFYSLLFDCLQKESYPTSPLGPGCFKHVLVIETLLYVKINKAIGVIKQDTKFYSLFWYAVISNVLFYKITYFIYSLCKYSFTFRSGLKTVVMCESYLIYLLCIVHINITLPETR